MALRDSSRGRTSAAPPRPDPAARAVPPAGRPARGSTGCCCPGGRCLPSSARCPRPAARGRGWRRSNTPLKFWPMPIGQFIGAVSSASRSWISSSSSTGSCASRSILLMKVMIGMSRRRQTSNSFRVCGSMPLAASSTMIARIDRRQRAVGVLAEILVARRVQQVEGAAGILERHHRGGDRDAALLLDLHPVRARAPPLALGPDLAGQMDRAAEQQQLLGQRGLAGVRMRDDREGAPPGAASAMGEREGVRGRLQCGLRQQM